MTSTTNSVNMGSLISALSTDSDTPERIAHEVREFKSALDKKSKTVRQKSSQAPSQVAVRIRQASQPTQRASEPTLPAEKLIEIGIGHRKKGDTKKATELFLQAVQLKSADAPFYLGKMETDPKDALKWYEIGKTRGSPLAYYGLGQVLSNDPVTLKRAVNCFEVAADGGIVNAMQELAKMYETGKGDVIQRDLNKALAWYTKASLKGDEHSSKKCAELTSIIAHCKAKADALKSKIAQNQAKIQELEAENLALQKELDAL